MIENDIKNASFIHKGGKCIIQEYGQKGTENTYIDFFMESEAGKEWYDKNKIISRADCESPDFIFKTSTSKTIGLEISNLFVKNKATLVLLRIANKICQDFKKEKGIALSILIDIYDERKLSPSYQEHLNYLYDPGFKHLEVSEKKIKNTFIAAILKEDIPKFGLRKIYIELPPHKFIVTIDRRNEPYTSVHVNNRGMCIEDPFDELQAVINSKNEKYKGYIEKCNECDLLVVSEDSSTGNFVYFSKKINKYKFNSAFKNVYLLDFGSHFDTKTTKLKTKLIHV
ncbi:MAG: hypothetical protein LBD19_02410 [Endomicrobium sp.]|jgi:hypothetical protein|nr:hypothetical protein [Endomicrobium sp.]